MLLPSHIIMLNLSLKSRFIFTSRYRRRESVEIGLSVVVVVVVDGKASHVIVYVQQKWKHHHVLITT